MTSPLEEGSINAPNFNGENDGGLADNWGFDSMGERDNFQATDHATIDRHIIR